MATTEEPTIYDELLDVLVDSANIDRLLTFRLQPEKQTRLEELLEKNRQGTLTPADHVELDEFERLEHFGRMLKARLRQKRQL